MDVSPRSSRAGFLFTHMGNASYNRERKYKIGDWCKWMCSYCGVDLDQNSIRIDHVTPKAKGGRDRLNNLTAACQRCNSHKWDFLLDVFLVRAIRNRDHAASELEYWTRVADGVERKLKESS